MKGDDDDGSDTTGATLSNRGRWKQRNGSNLLESLREPQKIYLFNITTIGLSTMFRKRQQSAVLFLFGIAFSDRLEVQNVV